MNLHAIFADTPAPAPVQAKVASDATPPTARAAAPSTSQAVQAAVNEVLTPTTKVASAGLPPAATLTKLAGEVAGLEKQARVQEGNLIGRAICDGFMSQLAVYEKVAAEQAQAQPQPFGSPTLAEKQAAEAAWQAEYDQTVGQIQKLAAEHYAYGHELAREALT